MSIKFSIVVPVYNEEGVIKEFIERVDKTISAIEDKYEILIINDASKDNSGKILNDLINTFKNLRIINNKKNLGLTGSSWKGFNEAKGDIIVFLPSDLESKPEEDIPKLLSALDSNTDLVVGWRYNQRQGFVKTIISKFFNYLSSLLFHIKVHDLGWIKAFRKEIIYNIEPLRSDWHRFFVILAAYEGYKIKEIKTKFYPRTIGKSKFGKFGLGRLVGGFFDLIVVKFHISFSKRPMFMFGSIGFFLSFLGFLGGIYLIYLKYTLGIIGNRAPLIFLVVLLIMLGIQFFALGFIAELLASLKEIIKRKK
jgi:glycosyltransferase involved in cell wall biosynthesis